MTPPLRNGIDPTRYFVGDSFRNLTEFFIRVVNDSTGMRANNDFERAARENPKTTSPDKDHVVATVRILQDAPRDLLQFTYNQAKALQQLIDWGQELRKLEGPSFLGDITPRSGDCRDWNQFVEAGYFN